MSTFFGFKTIPEGHVAIVENWGKFDRVLKPGLNFINPFTESLKTVYSWGRVANKHGNLIEMTEQHTDTPERHCQTKDNVTIKASSSIAWRIIDPKKAVYEVDVLTKTISDIALNALRSNIGKLKFDEMLSSRTLLNDTILKELSGTTKEWGVDLLRVEIQQLTYSDETARAMMQEMIAERGKRAAITQAEGEKQAKIMKAEGKAEAMLIEMRAKAEIKQMEAHSDGKYLVELIKVVSAREAVEVLKAHKYNESLQIMTENPASKIFIPGQKIEPMVAA